jgi:hypothetical protein
MQAAVAVLLTIIQVVLVAQVVVELEKINLLHLK